MGRYRKKPVEIEARQINSEDYDDMLDIVKWCGGRAVGDELIGEQRMPGNDAVIAIDTLEGVMYGNPGDWIIKGVQGEFYPCKPDIFEATYEKVEE